VARHQLRTIPSDALCDEMLFLHTALLGVRFVSERMLERRWSSRQALDARAQEREMKLVPASAPGGCASVRPLSGAGRPIIAGQSDAVVSASLTDR
jgi:hypothetical protein